MLLSRDDVSLAGFGDRLERQIVVVPSEDESDGQLRPLDVANEFERPRGRAISA